MTNINEDGLEVVESQFFADEVIAYVMLEAVTVLRTVGATDTAESLITVVDQMSTYLPEDGQVGFVLSDAAFGRLTEFHAAGGFAMLDAIAAQAEFQQDLADEADAADGDDAA